MSDRFSRRSALAAGAMAAGGLLLGTEGFGAERKRRVVVWSEGSAPKNVYPKDINTAVAEGLKSLKDWEVVTASLADPDQGVSDDSLEKTNVLIWWGHVRHGNVKDDLVARIVRRVKEEGMGFIALHSSHFSKALKKLLGTRCGFSEYVVDGSSVEVIVKDKKHPIARGVKDFTLEKTERYGEPFQVPKPETVVFDGVYHAPGRQHREVASRARLDRRQGQGILLPAGPRDLSALLRRQRAANPPQRRGLGRALGGRRRVV